jgi:hypothetical protein
MPVTINGTAGLVTSSISTPAGTAATPSVSDTAQDAGMFFPAANTIALSTSNAERVRIDSSGNVGVGTNSTGGYRVAIVGSAASSIPLYLNSDATNGYVYTPNPLYMGSTGAYQLAFVTNNTEKMRIAGDTGNVAIGTTATTSARLTVARGPGPQPLGEVYGFDGTQWWSLNSNAAAGGYSPLVLSNDHALIYSNGTADTGGFTLAQWSNSARGIRIDSSGNVGIGTSSPAQKLDVNGTIKSSAMVVSGAVTAASFSGDGSGLTGISSWTGNMSTAIYPTTVTNSSGTPMVNTGTGTFTFTVPAGVTRIKVTVVGGGGGGGTSTSYPGGGGAGGTAIRIFDVVAGTGYTCTVGAGASALGGSGGTSSFGPVSSVTVTATGGAGASTYQSGRGGDGSSGTLNMHGGDGQEGGSSGNFPIGSGGSSFLGGGSRGRPAPVGAGYGGGAGGTQAAGGVGIIVVEY